MYRRRVKSWLPEPLKLSLQPRYAVELIRSVTAGEGYYIQTVDTVSPGIALLLDLELSEYIILD